MVPPFFGLKTFSGYSGFGITHTSGAAVDTLEDVVVGPLELVVGSSPGAVDSGSADVDAGLAGVVDGSAAVDAGSVAVDAGTAVDTLEDVVVGPLELVVDSSPGAVDS